MNKTSPLFAHQPRHTTMATTNTAPATAANAVTNNRSNNDDNTNADDRVVSHILPSTNRRSFFVEIPKHISSKLANNDDPNHHHPNVDDHRDETESTTSMSTLSHSCCYSYSPAAAVAVAQRGGGGRVQRATFMFARRRLSASSGCSSVKLSSSSPLPLPLPPPPPSRFKKHVNNTKNNANSIVVTKATTYKKPVNTSSPMNLPWMMHENLPFLSSKAVFQIHWKRPAIFLQAAVRGWLQRQRHRQFLLATKFHPAATTIQTALRGMLQRLRFYNFCQELLEEYYATNIQAWFRGAHLRRRIVQHESAMILQDAVRAWLQSSIRPRRLKFVRSSVHVELARQCELKTIESRKQREMQRIRAEVEAEFAAAAAKGETIIVVQEPTAKELRLQASVAEHYQMVEHLQAEHAKLKRQQKKLAKNTAALLAKHEKSQSSLTPQQVKRIQDVDTLRNDVIPRLEHSVQMGLQVTKEWQEEIQETQRALLECDLRIRTEKRTGMITLSFIQHVVETVDEHDDYSNDDDDSDDESIDDEELAYYIKKLAFQVEFETVAKRCNHDAQQERYNNMTNENDNNKVK